MTTTPRKQQAQVNILACTKTNNQKQQQKP